MIRYVIWIKEVMSKLKSELREETTRSRSQRTVVWVEVTGQKPWGRNKPGLLEKGPCGWRCGVGTGESVWCMIREKECSAL